MRWSLLDRYLFGPFVRTFTVTALSMPLLFVLADITARLDALLGAGMTTGEILLLYPSQFPTYLTLALPIATLVATVFTLQPFVRNGELHAALGSGIPLYRLVRPLIVGGAAASFLGLALVEAVPRLMEGGPLPQGHLRSAAVERADFAYLTDAGEILSAERLDATGKGHMKGVVVRSAGADPQDPVRYIVAEEAVWTEGGGWVIRNGGVWSIGADGVRRFVAFEHLAHPTLTERPEDLLEAHAVDPASMSFRELGLFADRLERSGSPSAYPRTKQWERITIPVTTLVIILFAAPLATVSGRNGGQLGAALALVFTIFYLALLRTSEALGVAGLLLPGLAASLPALVFGAAGLLLLRRART